MQIFCVLSIYKSDYIIKIIIIFNVKILVKWIWYVLGLLFYRFNVLNKYLKELFVTNCMYCLENYI